MTKKGLKGFQNRFISAVLRPGIRRAVLSLPRGNGKSWLAGFLASEALRPGALLLSPSPPRIPPAQLRLVE